MTPERPIPPEHEAAGGSVAGSGADHPVIPDFELIREIGHGSYGDVWLARGLTGVYRAIKIVWRDRFTSAEPFEREFKGLKKFTTMSLPEAGQLALLHVGQNEKAGFFYYVMELADDVETGREVNPSSYAPLTLRELRTRHGRLPAKECLRFGVELARSLAGLHSRGLVHRDIKPSNVILVGGVPKLADIGLVASTGEALTYVGTEGFVPPEGPGKPAADVYALGRLLYELATGLDREEFPRLPPELGKVADRKALLELNEIILRACEPSSDRRYADASAILADLLVLQGGNSARLQRAGAAFRRAGVVLAVLALVATVVVWWRTRSVSPAAAAVAAAPEKSIAVLPFANESEEKKTNAFFADGVHEDLLTLLTRIAELKVISRNSVMHYRGTTESPRQIGRELGVAYVLEGSVRQAGQKVRVTGRLIRAATEEQVWAQLYDGELTDIFTLQTKLATSIAAELKAVLTPRERDLISARPTADPEVYSLYLQARALRFGQKALSTEILAPMQVLLERAVHLDPNFVPGWSELAHVHTESYFQNEGDPAANLQEAKLAIDRVVALAPDSPEAHQALGDYNYLCFHDYASATQHYLRLIELMPGSGEARFSLGLVARRQGQWREAVENLRRARELDPLNHEIGLMLFGTLVQGAHYAEGLAVIREISKASPDQLRPAYLTAFYQARVDGTPETVEKWLASLPPAIRRSPETVGIEVDWAWMRGDAARVVRLFDSGALADEEDSWDIEMQLATALAVLGQTERSRALAEKSRKALEEIVATDPTKAALWCILGQDLALLGKAPEAVAAADHAVGLAPESIDRVNNPAVAVKRARVLAWAGHKDEALREISRLVRVTFGLQAEELATSLDWFPLRGDPQFDAIARDPANRAEKF